MAVFTYKALAGTDDVIGTIAADTARQARVLLGERGLIVRDMSDVTTATRADGSRRSFGLTRFRFVASVRRNDLTAILGELATLMGAGVPVLESLDTLAKQYRGTSHDSLIRLRDRIAGGVSVAGAMREQPRVFDELAINIAEVGEDAGTLDTSLQRLAEFRQKSDQLRNRLATALIYPVIVSVVGMLCSLFLMTFIVPKILQPLIEQNLPLPFPTRVVKAASDGLIDWWWLLLVICAVIVGVVSMLLSTDKGRRRWHAMQLRIPIFGTLLQKQIIVRVAVVLSTLLKSGIVLTRALQIAQRSASNRIMADALRDCEIQITAGTELSTAMESTGVFPPMVVQVFALGQHSGRLEEMLDRLAEAYEAQVAVAAQRLAALLEPAMIVVLAGFVLFIVLATVLPILEVGNSIQ